MDLYLIIFCIVILFVIVIKDKLKSKPNNHNLMVTEGFSRRFFNQFIKYYFTGLDYPQLFGNEYYFMNLVDKIIPTYNIVSQLVVDSIMRYDLCAKNKIQFMIARGHTLHNVIYKIMPGLADFNLTNLRFVASLYRLPVTIITHCTHINEFGKLRNSGLRVNIGPKYTSDYFVSLELLLAYGMTLGKDIIPKHYELYDIAEHYGDDIDVVVMSLSHPNHYTEVITNKKLSRLVEIREFNDGNIYKISLQEERFYREYPYYFKTLLIKSDLSKYYPDLILYEGDFDRFIETPLITYDSLFVRTIGLRNYLLSNTGTDPVLIAELLMRMKNNLDKINNLEFIDDTMDSTTMGDWTLPIHVHDGAREFFYRSGLFTDIDNPNCIYIDGKCTYELLQRHHLLNDMGPTFNEIYNSDVTVNPYVEKTKMKIILA